MFSEEPQDNFNAEKIAKYEEDTKMFICLVCRERFIKPIAQISKSRWNNKRNPDNKCHSFVQDILCYSDSDATDPQSN